MSDQKIEFVKIEAKPSTNEYDDIVAALIASGDPDLGYPLTVDTEKVEGEVRKFGRAANRAGKSPKRGQSSEKDGKTTVVVGLRPQIVRGGTDEVVTEDTETAAE